MEIRLSRYFVTYNIPKYISIVFQIEESVWSFLIWANTVGLKDAIDLTFCLSNVAVAKKSIALIIISTKTTIVQVELSFHVLIM